MNTGEYINLVPDTLEESNLQVMIRNVCPIYGGKAQIDGIEIHISSQLTDEQKQVLLNMVIDQSCKVFYTESGAFKNPITLYYYNCVRARG